MSTYFEKLQDPRWQKKRLEVFKRDNFTCRDCGNAESTLHVHHCAYCGNPWEAPLSVLLTLCAECHEFRQVVENEAHVLLGTLMAKRSAMGNLQSPLADFVYLELLPAAAGKRAAEVPS